MNFTDTPSAERIIDPRPTDWPHPAIQTPIPNDGDLLDLLHEWVPNIEMRKAVLVDNPSKLYDFC